MRTLTRIIQNDLVEHPRRVSIINDLLLREQLKTEFLTVLALLVLKLARPR